MTRPVGDHATVLHPDDAVRRARGDGIVGDEHEGGAGAALHPQQFAPGLLAQGAVERAQGFVEQQQLGPGRQRAGPGAARALAAVLAPWFVEGGGRPQGLADDVEGRRGAGSGRDRGPVGLLQRRVAPEQDLGPVGEVVEEGPPGEAGPFGDLGDIDALADRVEREFGTVDALFVNAGVTRFVPFEAMTEEVDDELLTVNAEGPYFTVQTLAPLLARGGGVVLTTSVSNVLGIPMISGYAASKAALRSMTRSLARELLPRGVRVNAVSPGPIDTGILDRSMPQEAAQRTTAQITEENPMGRFGEPAEIARAVLFLAFDATYTTGAELAVDGGGSQL